MIRVSYPEGDSYDCDAYPHATSYDVDNRDRLHLFVEIRNEVGEVVRLVRVASYGPGQWADVHFVGQEADDRAFNPDEPLAGVPTPGPQLSGHVVPLAH